MSTVDVSEQLKHLRKELMTIESSSAPLNEGSTPDLSRGVTLE